MPPQHGKDAEGLEFEIVHHEDGEEEGELQAKIGGGGGEGEKEPGEQNDLVTDA